MATCCYWGIRLLLAHMNYFALLTALHKSCWLGVKVTLRLWLPKDEMLVSLLVTGIFESEDGAAFTVLVGAALDHHAQTPK